MADLELIKKLRAETGAGLSDVKEALDSTEGDYEKAKIWIEKKGMARADKRSDRETFQGVIGSYIHNTNQVAALVEVNCETDFVAKSEDFVQFSKDIAMQVVAMSPRFVSKDEIKDDVKAELKKEVEDDANYSSKPEEIKNKIFESKLENFIKDNCLLHQPLFKDESKTVEELLKSLSAKVGEAVRIRRFVRFMIGE